MDICDRCHRRRTRSWYQFHYGTLVTAQPGYNQVTYGYEGITSEGAAICGWCATRYVVLRYIMPFSAVIALELAAYFKLSAGTLRLTEVGIYVATVVVILMLAVLGQGLWHGIAYTMLRRDRGVLRFLVAGLILMLGTVCVVWPMIWWLDASTSEETAYEDLGAPALWFIWIPVGAQLLLLLGLVTGRRALLETQAWRLKRKRLRSGRSVWRSKIQGWNSVQFSRMHHAEDVTGR
ncbi:hypothetical protein ACQEVC_12870 [Plantactinospora sp. CA-294935]|uniref:hypothetical protein n=1 Tax=Plantactinospora sp. CA-294935 TaxID=3240012 RepID=UPI003D8A97F9